MVWDGMVRKIAEEDWITEGLRLLAEPGKDRLRIQTLADRLQVTKGSFYHHFRDRQQFMAEAGGRAPVPARLRDLPRAAPDTATAEP